MVLILNIKKMATKTLKVKSALKYIDDLGMTTLEGERLICELEMLFDND